MKTEQDNVKNDMQIAADVLSTQRNMALNEVVNLNIILTKLDARTKELEVEVKRLTDIIKEVAPDKLK